MQPQYFEVMFSGSHGGVTRNVRVCVELNDEDKELLSSGKSTELITQVIERRTGILDLLPAGLDDEWQRSGRSLDRLAPRNLNKKPTVSRGEHNIWISNEARKSSASPISGAPVGDEDPVRLADALEEADGIDEDSDQKKKENSWHSFKSP
jgi:hypothetical protein